MVGKPVFANAIAAAAECGIQDQNVYMIEEEPHEKYQSIWALAGKEEFEPRHLSPKEARDRTAFMCYSSGTTGRAKGGNTAHSLLRILSRLMGVLPSGDNTLQSDGYYYTTVHLRPGDVYRNREIFGYVANVSYVWMYVLHVRGT